MFPLTSPSRLRRSSARSGITGRRPIRRRAIAVGLEPLEQRVVLSTVTWINSQGGDWDTGSNWSGGQVPSIQDNAVISLPNLNITHSSPTADAVHSLSSQSPIALSAGSLELESASSVNGTLSLSGGQFNVKANLSLKHLAVTSGSVVDNATLTVGSLTWAGGGFSGNGQVNLSQMTMALTGAVFSNATMNLGGNGVSLAGTSNLPLVGKVALSGTVQDASHYSLTAPVPSAKLGGFALTNGVATLSAAGLAFSADASLPIIGAAHLSGSIQDAAHYNLTASLPTLGVGGFALTKDTVTLSAAGLSLTGTAQLPVIGSLGLSGTIADASHYSLAAPVPSAKLGGFALTNGAATVSAAGLAFSADASLPIIGAAHLSGSIQDAAHYSLTASLPTLGVGGFALTKDTVTLSAAGLSLSGTRSCR